MFCPKCGEMLPDGAKFCTSCGAPVQQQESYVNPECDHPHTTIASEYPQVTLGDAVKLFISRYAEFSGRSRRSEYWWAFLAIGLVNALLNNLPESLSIISTVWSLATLVPQLALISRRFHDIGKSAWWILINLIPLFGQIWMLVLFTRDSVPGANKWGPSPKYNT